MIKGEGAEELLDAIEFKIVITPCGRRRAGEVKRADKFNTTAAYHCRARSAVITGQLGSVDWDEWLNLSCLFSVDEVAAPVELRSDESTWLKWTWAWASGDE